MMALDKILQVFYPRGVKMTKLETVQRAVDYIEENLKSEIAAANEKMLRWLWEKREELLLFQE